MELVKERLVDRALDVLDWIDYRPDPHWWQYLTVPVLLFLAYFFTPMGLGPALVIFSVGITSVALIFWFAVLFLIIAWRAVRDVIENMLRKRRATRPAYRGPRILVGRFS
ncbi:MAG TPA: hypothetical protein VK934_01450 [Fimbriimonas sp.]|nr:hypothetical protein [Fimbriimonas sp.]